MGYGKQKRSNVTGAVATVKSDGLLEQPVPSVELALQGKAPGVQVANTGGRAGNNTQISIRGNGSLSASNSPLYIIDGVPQESLGNLTAEDIQSMEVLKDAASSAIYGSRASNDKTFNSSSDEATIYFTKPLVVKAGSTVSVDVV